MAPLPESNTTRFVVRYRWRATPYKVQYRFVDGTNIADCQIALDAFHAAVDGLFLTNWDVPGDATWADKGSNVSIATSVASVSAGGGGADPGDPIPDAQGWQILGRSAAGRRASWTFPGLALVNNKAQRVYRTASASLDTMLDAFEALIVAGLVCIDEQSPLLKQYSNMVINDYKTQQARRG